MNLAFDNWIPCLKKNGESVRASILGCFTDTDLAGLNVRPHERVALMRLLECVAYAAAKKAKKFPKDNRGRKALREPLAAFVEAYLTEWRDSFNLFDEKKPFLQIPDLQAGSAQAKKGGEPNDYSDLTPASKLSFSLATGNNSTLFDHGAASGGARQFDEESLALWVLTYQHFCPGGLTGVVSWQGLKTEKQSTDCPCVSKSMLHTFIQGDSLPNTIWLNLLTEKDLRSYKEVAADFSGEDGEDFAWLGRPVWEMFPQGPNDGAARANATRTFLGRLVPLGRLVKIMPDRGHILVGSIYDFPGFDSAFPKEVTATSLKIQKEGKEPEVVLLGYRPGQKIWRQLAALSVKRNFDAGDVGGCAALSNIPHDEPTDIIVCALAHDKASLTDSVESVYRVRAGELGDSWHAALNAELKYIEGVNGALRAAFAAWRHQEDGGLAGRMKKDRDCESLLVSAVEADFYARAERLLPFLMKALDRISAGEADGEIEKWEQRIARCGEEVLSDRCDKASSRQLMAYVKARVLFTGRLAILRKKILRNKE